MVCKSSFNKVTERGRSQLQRMGKAVCWGAVGPCLGVRGLNPQGPSDPCSGIAGKVPIPDDVAWSTPKASEAWEERDHDCSVLRLKGIPCPPAHRTPPPALPSPGITRFFLGIRRGDWEGLPVWERMIPVCRHLPAAAEGLLLRKEVWSCTSVCICSIWASSQPWLCCGHPDASSLPALEAGSANPRLGPSLLSLPLVGMRTGRGTWAPWRPSPLPHLPLPLGGLGPQPQPCEHQPEEKRAEAKGKRKAPMELKGVR